MVRPPRPSARADAASDVVNDDGLTQQLAHTLAKGRCRLWIKLGKTQSEQMFSALPPEAEVTADIREVAICADFVAKVVMHRA